MNKWSHAGLLLLGMMCNAFGYQIKYWQVQLTNQNNVFKDFFLYESDVADTVVIVTHEGNKIDCDAKEVYKRETYLKTNPPMVDEYFLIIGDDYELNIAEKVLFKLVRRPGRNRKIAIGKIISQGFVEREFLTPAIRPMISQPAEIILK